MNEGQTHWQGCWEDHKHHECAVVQIRMLRLLLSAAEAKIDGLEERIKDMCKPYTHD